MGLTYKSLKDRHKAVREAQQETTRLRIHRALSWLKAADDSDTKFIHLWICFNAIYAQDFDARDTFGEKC